MLIDWFTVFAQLINFAILAAILERFVYRRILQVVDDREQTISSRLEDAENEKNEASREAEELREKQRQWSDEQKERLARATEEVEARRRALLDEARDEVDSLRIQWHETLEREKESFLERLRIETGAHTYALARRALADLANRELERQILDVFIDRLREADDASREGLAGSARSAGGKLTVRSAFALSDEDRELVSETVRATLFPNVTIRFDRSPELICGIELATTDHKLGWSLQSYLDSLQELALDALQSKRVARDDREEPDNGSNTREGAGAGKKQP